jgi:hypothetical protein
MDARVQLIRQRTKYEMVRCFVPSPLTPALRCKCLQKTRQQGSMGGPRSPTAWQTLAHQRHLCAWRHGNQTLVQGICCLWPHGRFASYHVLSVVPLVMAWGCRIGKFVSTLVPEVCECTRNRRKTFSSRFRFIRDSHHPLFRPLRIDGWQLTNPNIHHQRQMHKWGLFVSWQWTFS